MNVDKIRTVKFRRSLSDLKTVKSSSIIFQRMNKLRYFKFLFTRKNIKSGEEDVIVIRHMPPLELDDIKAGGVFDIDEIENAIEITDKEFKEECINACHVCHRYARIFLIAELITKFADMFMFIVIPLYSLFEWSTVEIIIFLSILFPIVLLQIMCDWGKLLEKYARLYIEFKKLCNNKNHDRIEKFQELVDSFKESWIYSDMMAEN